MAVVEPGEHTLLDLLGIYSAGRSYFYDFFSFYVFDFEWRLTHFVGVLALKGTSFWAWHLTQRW